MILKRFVAGFFVISIAATFGVRAVAATSLLFIGNSFTFGYGSGAWLYRANSVTDLNGEGTGGVPALFKSFTEQVGLDYMVALETRGGAALDFHYENKRDVIGSQGWDVVVMHGYSTLDRDAPGNPTKLIYTARQMTEFLQSHNADVEVYLTATWSRADLTYQEGRAWSGKPIAQMAKDVRAGYDRAAKAITGIKAVNGVGEAWTRAMDNGVADPNPYDGISPQQIDLWTWDHYHASSYGYYLEALVVFGNVTGVDPRSLGDRECSAFELGLAPVAVRGLQEAAHAQLVADGRVLRTATLVDAAAGRRCAPVNQGSAAAP